MLVADLIGLIFIGSGLVGLLQGKEDLAFNFTSVFFGISLLDVYIFPGCVNGIPNVRRHG